ncbi:MAG: hypothetical protein GEV04_21440 [Actinophytocola sp.]|nr:hypothetical protein [Actinophytocola sp.]
MVKLARLAAIGVFAAVLALFGGTLSASAGHWTSVTQVGGNPACEGGLKIEPVTSGTYGPVTIAVSGSSFGFSSTEPVVEVIVKGGPNANVYTYDPGVLSDSGLTAPLNPKNDRPYGLSHLCFFFGDGKTPPDDPKDPDPKDPEPDPGK